MAESTLLPMRAFQHFFLAARSLSLSEAARRLDVTQSAVSQQVKFLENWLGCTLFHRQGRRLTLTDHGVFFLAALEGSFAMVTAAAAALRRQQGIVVIAAPAVFAHHWLKPRLARYAQIVSASGFLIDPRLLVDESAETPFFQQADLEILLDSVSEDKAIAPRASGEPEPALLLEEVLLPVCSPLLLGKTGNIRFASDLAQYPLLHSESWPEDYWQQFQAGTGWAQLRPLRGLKFKTDALCLAAALEGQGVALSESLSFQEDLRRGRLVQPLPLALPTGRGYILKIAPGASECERTKELASWLYRTAAEDR